MRANPIKVDGLGIVTTSTGDLCTNIQDLGRLISPRDDAYARVHSDIGRTEGTSVSMIVVSLKGELHVLVRDGMTEELARNLFDANSKNRYYSTGSPEQYEIARETADKENKEGIAFEKREAIVCPSQYAFNMSPTANPNHLVFIFQDMAQKYFDKNGKPITFYPIDANIVDGKQPELLSNPDGTIQNYMWFRSLDCSSELGGYDRGADSCYNRTRGVSVKNLELSTEDLELLRQIRAGNLAPKELERILGRH